MVKKNQPRDCPCLLPETEKDPNWKGSWKEEKKGAQQSEDGCEQDWKN